MWVGRGLVVGVLLSLAAGGLTFAVAGQVDPRSATDANAAITVPVGRIGDQVAYQVLQRWPGEDDFSVAVDEDYLDKGRWEIRVVSADPFPDASGELRPALQVARPSRTFSGTDGVLEMEQEWRWAGSGTDHIDLATRDSLALEYNQAETRSDVGLRQRKIDNSLVIYGPHLLPEILGAGLHTKMYPFGFQNRTYSPGQDATREAREFLQEAFLFDFHPSWELSGVRFSGTIAGPATVDGHDAVGVHLDGCFRIDVSRRYGYSWSQLGFLNHGSFKLPAEFCYQVKMWLSADFSYPILREGKVAIDGTMAYEMKEVLLSFEAGVEPIPWGQDTAAQAYRTMDPDLARTDSGQRHPADGSATRIPYRLSQAVLDVSHHPLLVRFQQWRGEHPDAELVGAGLGPVGPDGSTMRWDLTFGTPQGQAFVVSTERKPGQPVPKVEEYGPIAGFGYDDAILPPGPITISAAEELWREYTIRPLPGGQAPNVVYWGFHYQPKVLYCPTTVSGCSVQEPQLRVHNYLSGPDSILIGYVAEPRASGAAHYRDWYHLADRYLYMQASTGRLTIQQADYKNWSVPPLAFTKGGSPSAAEEEDPKTPVPVLGIQAAALVSGSLLALFLAAYFFPVLKHLGAEAIGLIPGYAKLHKRKLLDNHYREQITNLVRAEPGITPQEIQATAGGAFNTIVYHLRVLERNKMVSSLLDGRNRRFFPTENVGWGERGRLAALRHVKTREMFEIIRSRPGIAPKELSRQSGVTRPGVYWHVDRLIRVGLVGHDRERGRTRFFANDPTLRVALREDAADVEVA